MGASKVDVERHEHSLGARSSLERRWEQVHAPSRPTETLESIKDNKHIVWRALQQCPPSPLASSAHVDETSLNCFLRRGCRPSMDVYGRPHVYNNLGAAHIPAKHGVCFGSRGSPFSPRHACHPAPRHVIHRMAAAWRVLGLVVWCGRRRGCCSCS